MNFQRLRKIGVASVFAAVGMLGSSAVAQVPSTVGGDTVPRPMRVTEGNNVHCAGYVTSSSIDTSNKIIGGEGDCVFHWSLSLGRW